MEAGVFSYFQDASDYPFACRGSISTLASTVTFPDTGDRSRLDVRGSGGVKYSLKARSPAEAKKWVWALMESQRWMKDLNRKSSQEPKKIGMELEKPAFNMGAADEDLEKIGQELKVISKIIKENNSDVNLETATMQNVNNIQKLDGLDVINSPLKEESLLNLLNSKPPIAPSLSNYSEDDKASVLGANSPREIHSLTYLLKAQMQIQQRTIETSIDLIQKEYNNMSEPSSDLNQLPSLLSHSSALVLSTTNKILKAHESRERRLIRSLRKEIEKRKRWQDVVQRVVGLAPESPQKHNISSIDGAEITDNDEEVFYDFDDDDDRSDCFFEMALGLEPLEKVEMTESFSSQVRSYISPSLESSQTHKDGPFITLGNIEEVCTGYEPFTRSSLPLDPSHPKPSLEIWSFLKSAIGKDLSKVALPVIFNEPLSMLQRMTEDMEYSELLSLAGSIGSSYPIKGPAAFASKNLGIDISKITDQETMSMFRLMLVGAFAMSNYSSTDGRITKPFNPILGETYELVNLQKEFRYLSEQVCHHPPISACHCESPLFCFWTEVNVKSKFWGQTVEVHPIGNP